MRKKWLRWVWQQHLPSVSFASECVGVGVKGESDGSLSGPLMQTGLVMVMALQFVLKLEREERKHEEIRIAGNSSEEYTSIVE